ncbi:hypothetical protein LZK75_25555 (plasmid) [Rhizobium leguminosarum]|nr:hypothetical protein LZK75_25555 [Rhizobium leguminosarum]
MSGIFDSPVTDVQVLFYHHMAYYAIWQTLQVEAVGFDGRVAKRSAERIELKYILLFTPWFWLIEILQVKYLNNTIEQAS